MAKIVTTAEKLVNDLKTLESRPTFYKNVYPYNLCYVHDNGKTSADCVNLYKALLNGYDVNKRTPGYFQNNLSNTGDVNEWGLEQQCSDLSRDFTKLKNGEPRLLYMEYYSDGKKHTHTGGFIGEFEKYGKTYNVCECTAAWGGGILFSYVDNQGRRFKSKGGAQNKAWTYNGLMTPWVDYSVKYPPYIYEGVNYKDVFDADYYYKKYKDLQKAIGNDTTKLFTHFYTYGMNECRQADAEFNMLIYKANYADLRNAYSNNYPLYYRHYCVYGKKEGRIADKPIDQTKPRKSYEEIAEEVIAGKWGTVPERRKRLEVAGYNYNKVQSIVNYKLNTYNANGIKYHTMKQGETLEEVAERYETTVNKIIALNNIKDPENIKAGQKVYIK